MFVKIVSTAVFIILTWLTMVSSDTNAVMKNVENSSSAITDSLNTSLKSSTDQNKIIFDDIAYKLEDLVKIQNEFKDKATAESIQLADTKKKLAAKDKDLKRYSNILSLRGAYTTVLEAEVFSRAKNGEAASKTLLSAKKPIYSASGHFEKSKQSLRELMGPIDVLAAKWKKGDFSESSIEIRKVLKAEINNNPI